MMYINGTSMAAFGITAVLGVDYGTSATTYYKDWYRASKSYIYRSAQTNYATPKITLLFEAADNSTVERGISAFCASLSRDSIITFSDRAFAVKGCLTGMEQEFINPKARKITATLEGCKVSNDITTLTLGATQSFYVDGNLDCGMIMRFNSPAAATGVNIVLNGVSFTLNNLAANEAYTFDTTAGTLTNSGGNNCMDMFDGWVMPYLIGGKQNLLSTNNSAVTKVIEYRGRWA